MSAVCFDPEQLEEQAALYRPRPLPSGARMGTFQRLVSEVAPLFGVTAEDVFGRRRTAAVALARQVSWYVARNRYTALSSTEIGAYFDRDHSTILNGLERVAERMQHDQHLAEIVRGLVWTSEGPTNGARELGEIV